MRLGREKPKVLVQAEQIQGNDEAFEEMDIIHQENGDDQIQQVNDLMINVGLERSRRSSQRYYSTYG